MIRYVERCPPAYHQLPVMYPVLTKLVNTLPIHLEIPNVPFAGSTMDCIGPLPATSKGNRQALMFICLLTSYLIMVPLKSKTVDEVSMVYIKEILPKTPCSKFILQDNGMEFKNDQLMSLFDTLGIKCIYSNPYYPQGNGRIEHVHNFLKHKIAKFIYGNVLKWDDALPLAIYYYNIILLVDDLASPYYLVHGFDLLEGRLSNIQSKCRYMGIQPGMLTVQELHKLWNLHAKLLAENRMAEPAADKKIASASDLKTGQLVLVKNQHKGPFDPTYTYDYWVAKVLNDSTVLLTIPDSKEKLCNIHQVKLVSSLEVHVGLQAEILEGTFPKFWDSIVQNSSGANTSSPQHLYNLRSKHNHEKYTYLHK